MTIKKLTTSDLLESIKYICSTGSSSDNVNTYSQSPAHVLLYNEIVRFSKQQLEETPHLYSAIKNSSNPLFFAALMQKKAFQNELTKESRWLLKQLKNPSLNLYESLYHYENDYKRFETNFLKYISRYLEENNTPERTVVLELLYQKYKTKDLEDLIIIAYKKVGTYMSDYLVERFNEDKIDINQFCTMNNLLPKPTSSNYSNFFISSNEFEQIHKLYSKGFCFNEDDYSYYGENLLTALLKSGRIDLVKTIVPYLSNSQPNNLTIEDQEKMLTNYKNQDYIEVKEIYTQLLHKSLEHSIEKKSSEKHTPKIKV